MTAIARTQAKTGRSMKKCDIVVALQRRVGGSA
jgi:hypothetical protein